MRQEIPCVTFIPFLMLVLFSEFEFSTAVSKMNKPICSHLHDRSTHKTRQMLNYKFQCVQPKNRCVLPETGNEVVCGKSGIEKV